MVKKISRLNIFPKLKLDLNLFLPPKHCKYRGAFRYKWTITYSLPVAQPIRTKHWCYTFSWILLNHSIHLSFRCMISHLPFFILCSFWLVKLTLIIWIRDCFSEFKTITWKPGEMLTCKAKTFAMYTVVLKAWSLLSFDFARNAKLVFMRIANFFLIAFTSLFQIKFYKNGVCQVLSKLLRDRSFFMREGGLVGFGKHHLKMIWPPSAPNLFHMPPPPLIAVIISDDPPPTQKKKQQQPSLKASTFLIFSITPLLHVIVLTMKTIFTIH